jgi:hypothetical protein
VPRLSTTNFRSWLAQAFQYCSWMRLGAIIDTATRVEFTDISAVGTVTNGAVL